MGNLVIGLVVDYVKRKFSPIAWLLSYQITQSSKNEPTFFIGGFRWNYFFNAFLASPADFDPGASLMANSNSSFAFLC